MLRVKVNKREMRELLERLESLKEPIDKETAKEVGDAYISEMKDMISKGISPIQGDGRFQRYKNPAKYPANQKPKTPVNLYLTGEMMRALKYEIKRVKSGFAPEVGYSTNEASLKEKGHREGAKGQPKRPTIPVVSKGEKPAARIQVLIKALFSRRIKRLAKK